MLVLGKDAYGAFAAVAEAQRAELEQWGELSLSTGIDNQAGKLEKPDTLRQPTGY